MRIKNYIKYTSIVLRLFETNGKGYLSTYYSGGDSFVEILLVNCTDSFFQLSHIGFIRKTNEVGAHMLLKTGPDMRVCKAEKYKVKIKNIHIFYLP